MPVEPKRCPECWTRYLMPNPSFKSSSCIFLVLVSSSLVTCSSPALQPTKLLLHIDFSPLQLFPSRYLRRPGNAVSDLSTGWSTLLYPTTFSLLITWLLSPTRSFLVLNPSSPSIEISFFYPVFYSILIFSNTISASLLWLQSLHSYHPPPSFSPHLLYHHVMHNGNCADNLWFWEDLWQKVEFVFARVCVVITEVYL